MLWNYSLYMILFIYFILISLFLILLGSYFLLNDFLIFIEYELFMLNSSQVVMTLIFDWMSLIFLGFVFMISSFIIYYSMDYMSGDFFMNRFLILILMFIFSMMFMILSPNMISIMLGWDGLGLVSYCLVIYYQNIKSFNSGMITALSNRVGDCLLLMSIAWMMSYGSWNYWMYIDFFDSSFNINLVNLFIIISGMTKSAQIPFSSWLPAAMAAPTPVSSLVHSSTLVTAGIYLLIRFNPLYLNSYFCTLLMIISLCTMFMSGFCANFEFDLKKIIALSTLSQLGLMMSILSFGYIYLSFFHLLIHALFKALLFMCSGVIIHNMKDCQDIRLFGNLFNQMPLTSICLMIANFCLCGMPFLSGFYSKDLILESYSIDYINFLGYILFYFSSGLTISYSFRLIYYLMISDLSFYSFYNFCDSSLFMLKPMYIMMFLSVLSGSLLGWLLFPTPLFIILPIYLKLMIIFISLLGFYLGYFLMKFNLFDYLINFMYLWFSMFFGNMWFMPFITIKISYLLLKFGLSFKNLTDSSWFELFGGQGIIYMLNGFSLYNQKIQNNFLNMFFIFISFWLIIFIFF
nr:NADH dehydrogenase subunit 5 [Orthomeria smaragdinum]